MKPEKIDEDVNLKMVAMYEYWYTKIFLQKVTLIIDLKRLLLLKKLKIVFCGHILLVILKLQKLFERFAKELQKINQTEFKVEKGIKKKKG